MGMMTDPVPLRAHPSIRVFKGEALIHGDALTQEELNTVAGAQNEEAAMRTLYRSWCRAELRF